LEKPLIRCSPAKAARKMARSPLAIGFKRGVAFPPVGYRPADLVVAGQIDDPFSYQAPDAVSVLHPQDGELGGPLVGQALGQAPPRTGNDGVQVAGVAHPLAERGTDSASWPLAHTCTSVPSMQLFPPPATRHKKSRDAT